MKRRAGFTLLEVLVATVIMGIAVAGLMAGLSQSVRNASRLTEHDRAAMLARTKMNELLLDINLPFTGSVDGDFRDVEPGLDGYAEKCGSGRDGAAGNCAGSLVATFNWQ
jgi:type II secretion system protein I